MSLVKRKHLYEQVAEHVSERISGGRYPAGQLPSEQSLAKEFGVSVVTLRKALLVVAEDGLIERRHGSGTYIRNWTPRSTVSRSRKTGLVGYIPCAGSEHITGSFFNYLLLATQAESNRNEYSCVLSHPELDVVPRPISQKRVDGILVAGTYYPHDISRPVPDVWQPITDSVIADNDSYMHMLASTGFPVVAIANYTNHPAVNRINTDCQNSFSEAIEYLIHNGHRRIAYWGGEKKWPEFAEREAAFRNQMHLHDLPCPDELIATYPTHGAFAGDTAIQAAYSALSSPSKPTAIIAGSGSTGNIETAASSLGLAIPRDLSLIAVTQCPAQVNAQPDGNSVADSSDERSVLEMPVREMAQAAIERLLDLVNGHVFAPKDREILIKMKLLRRSTVARCRD